MRQNLSPGRMTLVSMACATMLAACGGGGGGGGSGEGGRLQVITFAFPGGPGGATMAEPRKLNATATSGLPVTFASTTPSTCKVEGDMLVPLALAECRVVATQGGGTTADGVKWAAADDTSQLFVIQKTTQVVMLQAPDYGAKDSQVTLAATTNSGLPVTFSVSTPDVCSVSGSTLTLLNKGSCALTASQAGDGRYTAAKADAFVAVDPLIVADGILGAGLGTTQPPIATKQGGAVFVNAYSSMIGGWEWCDPTPDHEGKCFRTVSDDERVFTSALHIPAGERDAGIGWHHDKNTIEIFGPGLSGFNQSGDTTGGLQVTTETTFAMTLGVNPGLYAAKKPVLLQMDLGKRNNGCNVTVGAVIWPASLWTGVGLPLDHFAVTNSCGLSGVNSVSEADITGLPNYNSGSPADVSAYLAQLEGANMKAARTSALALIQSSNVVRVRITLNDNINVDFKDPDTNYFGSDLSIAGAIKLQ